MPAWQMYRWDPQLHSEPTPAALESNLPCPTCPRFLHLAPGSHPVPWATASPCCHEPAPPVSAAETPLTLLSGLPRLPNKGGTAFLNRSLTRFFTAWFIEPQSMPRFQKHFSKLGVMMDKFTEMF